MITECQLCGMKVKDVGQLRRVNFGSQRLLVCEYCRKRRMKMINLARSLNFSEFKILRLLERIGNEKKKDIV